MSSAVIEFTRGAMDRVRELAGVPLERPGIEAVDPPDPLWAHAWRIVVPGVVFEFRGRYHLTHYRLDARVTKHERWKGEGDERGWSQIARLRRHDETAVAIAEYLRGVDPCVVA